MPTSFYNPPSSTRGHFVEPPSMLARLRTGLHDGFVLSQRLWNRHGIPAVAAAKVRAHRSLRQARRGWTLRRLPSVPHALVAVWLLLLLWGERWVFESSIAACEWGSWESWPSGATPHHLVFLADPQLVDPHSYPGRPWPLSTFTMLHTDNYLKRSYIQLQTHLRPDTVFFLGDLFDGGREWNTARGDTSDQEWAKARRPSEEKALLKKWRRKYGESFWLREYDRFGRIFYNFWGLGGEEGRPGQRGRKIISSLPGNHDLGFGEQVKIPIRDRFEAYFGEGNRVDVVGNHTVVSIDAVSFSARSEEHGTPEITGPVEEFLSNVQSLKRKAVARELDYQAGRERALQYPHLVEDLYKADLTKLKTLDPGPGSADFPTILLTHVPLYRPPGTPCGPQRERWPPTPPPKGQSSPVNPDDRNSLPVASGYQYQTVLGEEDSVRLVSQVGNVVSVFSGDDHDYCEVVHPTNKNNAREITVKSMSWTMGVRKPGFLMLSMWNPVGPDGTSLSSLHGVPSASPTMESHLCILPDQIGIFARYGTFIALSALVLIIRAILTPLLNLPAFSAPYDPDDSPLLPASIKDTKRDDDPRSLYPDFSSTSSTSTPASLAPRSAAARTRSVSPAAGYGLPASQARHATPPLVSAYAGPLDDTVRKTYGTPGKKRGVLELVWREAWMSGWRVAWMVLAVYLWLAWYG